MMNIGDQVRRDFMNENTTVKRYVIDRLQRKLGAARTQRNAWKARAEQAELALRTMGNSFWQTHIRNLHGAHQQERMRHAAEIAALQQKLGAKVMKESS
jgi:hypothetical protein